MKAGPPLVRGWCPGALRPMMSGDGLLVRLRPPMGQLNAVQMVGLCRAAQDYGAGLIEVTRRGNLQIRGVAEDVLPALQAVLADLELLDDDALTEGRRNILMPPDWCEDDDSHRIARDLIARLPDLPDLPAKIGFGIDAGSAPVLSADSADFRIERGEDGGLILRADGRATGVSLNQGQEVDALIRFAHWFADSGGAAVGRMARHHAALPDWANGHIAPAAPRLPLLPGPSAQGLAVGLAFGQADARGLARLLDVTGAAGVRVTPWRVLLLLGAQDAPDDLPPDLLVQADAPALRVDACPGAPSCPQATVPTRALALRLASHVNGRLHVSGCAKGCARSTPADTVLTGCGGCFDLARHARAGAEPLKSGLTKADLLTIFGVS